MGCGGARRGASTWRAFARAFALAALAIAAATAGASAQGAEEEPALLLDRTQGNFRAAVAMLPVAPAVGSVNFTVRLTAAEGGEPIRDARVRLVAYNAEDIPTYQTRALNTPSAPGEYVGNITFKASGVWSIHVEAQSETLGAAAFVAPLAVAPAAVGGGAAGGWVMLGALLALFLGGGFVWLSSRRALKRRGAGVPTN